MARRKKSRDTRISSRPSRRGTREDRIRTHSVLKPVLSQRQISALSTARARLPLGRRSEFSPAFVAVSEPSPVKAPAVEKRREVPPPDRKAPPSKVTKGCKRRPDSRGGKGSGRSFVPWCDRKR